MPYYVVWVGRKNGIYENWKACEEQIKGYKGAIYKKFVSFHDAKKAFMQHPEKFVRLDTACYTKEVQRHNQAIISAVIPEQAKQVKKQKRKDTKTINAHNKKKEQLVGLRELNQKMMRDIGIFIEQAICVDASCIVNKEVSNSFGKVEYRGVWMYDRKEIFHSKVFPKGTINMVEFLAIVDAIRHTKQAGISNPVIFSDSLTAMQWVAQKTYRTNLERNHETEELFQLMDEAVAFLRRQKSICPILKWQTQLWGDIPADFERK